MRTSIGYILAFAAVLECILFVQSFRIKSAGVHDFGEMKKRFGDDSFSFHEFTGMKRSGAHSSEQPDIDFVPTFKEYPSQAKRLGFARIGKRLHRGRIG